MNPSTIKVQIPPDIFAMLKPYFMQVDLLDLQNFIDWCVDLYRETKSPGVQWYLGETALPDAYGYLYTYWIVSQAVAKVK